MTVYDTYTLTALHATVVCIALKYELQYLHTFLDVMASEARGKQIASLLI